VVLVLTLLLPSTPSYTFTHLTIAFNYKHVDEEFQQFSNIVEAGGVVYVAGSKGAYVFVAAYDKGGRLWARSLNLGGNATVLNLSLEKGFLELIAHSRTFNATRLSIVRVGLDGTIAGSEHYTIYPRLFPLVALRIEDSVYIAGASYILGQNFNYMVARVSGKGVEWVQEDIGGPGSEVLKCAGVTLGSRILVVGDNGTSISIMIVSQLGDILKHYIISYANVSVALNGCLKLEDSKFIAYGAIGGRPLLIPLIVEPSLDIRVPSQNVGDMTGVITAGAGRGDIAAFYVTSGDQSVILVYRFKGSGLELIGAVNITDVARGFIALSASYSNNSLTYAGYLIGDKPKALILSLTMTLTDTLEKGPSLLRIPLLEYISDPRLTLALLLAIVVLSAYVAYGRVRMRRPKG
jgi:hypothetical protein